MIGTGRETGVRRVGDLDQVIRRIDLRNQKIVHIGLQRHRRRDCDDG